jgi:glycosyltransferase involved in cell wall biosynthesis
MKVSLGVLGRFHIFDLAKQLSNYGYLSQFFTTYPNFMVKRWGIEATDIKCFPTIEFFNRIHYRYLNSYISNEILRVWFDKNISKLLNCESDIYVAWGGSITSMENARNLDIKVICEQGSTHVLYAQKIRDEEYSKSNIKNTDKIPNELVKRELRGYELADFICIPSTFVMNSFIEYGIPKSKLLLNPYGVNLNNFKQSLKLDNVFRIIFTGSVGIRKGCQYLIKAFEELNLSNAELIFIGPIEKSFYQFVSRVSNSNIKFIGPKPQSELYKYYSQGSVFVIMSIEEGLAMVQLQAMACGLPLICTPNTGGEDLIDNGKEGYIVPIRDIRELKEKLFYLYKNPDLAIRMGQLGKIKVQKGYSWNDYGYRMINYYKNIVKL